MAKTFKEPLRYQLLTYIAYSLKDGHVFSHLDAQKAIAKYFGRNYEITTLRKEYSLIKKEGFVELKKYYRKSYPILTQKGRLQIKTRLPYKQFGPWDGCWRMVSFNIPERDRLERRKLVQEMEKLGFAPIQRSTFLGPYPLLGIIGRLATDLGVRQHLRLLEVKKIDHEKETLEKIWGLKEINSRYLSFIHRTKVKKNDRFWPLAAKRLEREFVNIYEIDPHLPEEFLPQDWTGQKAYMEFKDLVNSY